MIPNVVEGGNPAGLMRYLLGPGRANEHVDPHLVAGDNLLLVRHGQEVLDRGDAREVAAYLDAPRRVHGVELRASTTRVDPATGDKVTIGARAVSVWHCSLSLPPGEGPVGDETWRAVATGFAERMGLTGADGRAPVRWVAVHHGPSKGGNDHVHVVASLVREDGARWEGRWGSKRAAQQACRDLEVVHGLTRVSGPERGVRERGVQPGEARRAVAAGLDPATAGPRDLAARLRAAAMVSMSEAEFVRRVRADGVVIKPRYAKGSTATVAGYKAALPPSPGSREWQFVGGGKLGRDLSLPRLRETWQTARPEDVAAAVAEWGAAHAGSPPVAVGREGRALNADAGRIAAGRLAAFNASLAMLDPGDAEGWAEAARQAAGAVAAWAGHDGHRGELPDAARALARSAQQARPGRPAAARVSADSARAAAMILGAGRGGGDVGRELARTAALVARRHQGLGHDVEATALATRAVAPLLAAAAAVGKAGRALERAVGSEPERPYGLGGLAPGHDSGSER